MSRSRLAQAQRCRSWAAAHGTRSPTSPSGWRWARRSARRTCPPSAWSTSSLLVGGAAQLLAVQLLSAGASGVVVAAAALIVNARMLLYGAAVAPHAAAWPARWRWLAAYLLADPVYALAAARFSKSDGGGPRVIGCSTTWASV